MSAVHEGNTWYSGAEPLPGLLPEGFGEFAGGVQGEGEQVEDDEHGGEGVPAVAEVVFRGGGRGA